MTQDRKPGRPQEWALEEEITQVYIIAAELKRHNPHAQWSDIKDMLKKQFEETGKITLLSKLDKITGLVKQLFRYRRAASADGEFTLLPLTKWKTKMSISGKFSPDVLTETVVTSDDICPIQVTSGQDPSP